MIVKLKFKHKKIKNFKNFNNKIKKMILTMMNKYLIKIKNRINKI